MRHLSRKRANVWQTLFNDDLNQVIKSILSILPTEYTIKKQCNLYRITQVLSNQCLTLKNTPLCRKKANKKRKSDNTPILSDSNDFLLNHKL